MNQWKIEISELMEQYTDTEFIPEEEHEVDVDLIKKRVITAVQGKRHTARRTGLVAAGTCGLFGAGGLGLRRADLYPDVRRPAKYWRKPYKHLAIHRV